MTRLALSIAVPLFLLSGCVAHLGAGLPTQRKGSTAEPRSLDLGSLVIRIGADPVTGLATYDGDVLFALGYQAFEEGRFDLSRTAYGQMLSVFPDHEDIVQASWNYALSLEKLGEVSQAIEAFDDYIVRTAPSEPGEAARGRLRLGILLQQEDRYEELAAVLDATETFEGFEQTEIWELRALRAIALGAEGAFHLSEAELNRVRVEVRQTSRRTGDLFPYQAAMVWYFAGELDRMQARSIVLNSVDDLELLDRQIGEKADLLMDARQRFKRTLEHGEPAWSGPAALALGGVYEDFRDDLLAAPSPSDLEPDVREVYEALLRERTQQFLDAAVKDYRSVLELARVLDLETPWIDAVSGALDRCEQALAEAPGEAR